MPAARSVPSGPKASLARRTGISTCLPPAAVEAGFTLLEIIIVLVIAAVLAGMMVPAMDGLLTQRRLRAVVADVSEAAIRTRLAARDTGVEQTLEFGDEVVAAPADSPDASKRTVKLPEDVKVFFSWNRKNWERARGFTWRFFPSGFSEPISLRIEAGRRWIELDFDLLTARVAEERYEL